jgi:hypothetical protein
MILALLGRSGSSWRDEPCPLLRSNRIGLGGKDDLCVRIGGVGGGNDSSVWLKPPRVQDKNYRRRSENWDSGILNSRTCRARLTLLGKSQLPRPGAQRSATRAAPADWTPDARFPGTRGVCKRVPTPRGRRIKAAARA